jgi:hypothetical protein
MEKDHAITQLQSTGISIALTTVGRGQKRDLTWSELQGI